MATVVSNGSNSPFFQVSGQRPVEQPPQSSANVPAGSLSPTPARADLGLSPPLNIPARTAEQAARDAADLSERQSVPSLDPSAARKTTQERSKQAVDNYKQALQAGVDVAKAGFMKKLWSLAASSAVLAAATIASVASLGAATPFLAVACVNMAICVGDVGCAWMTHRNALALNEQKDPPYPNVKMGGNCLANLVYPIALSKFKSGGDAAKAHEDARKVATGVADCLKGGLMIAGFTMGCLSPVHMAAAGTALKATAASMKLLLSGYMVKHPQNVGASLPRATETMDPIGNMVSIGAQLDQVQNGMPITSDSMAANIAVKKPPKLQFETVLYALQGINSTRHLAGLALAEVGIGLDEVVVGGVVEGAHAVAAGAGSVGAFVAQLGAVLDWLG